MNIVELTIQSCWAILSTFWIISAFFQKPVAKTKRPNLASRIIVLLLFIVPFILALKHDFYPSYIVIVKQSLTTDIISIFLCILGLFTAIWARITLAGNWSGRVVFKKGHELVQKGPYQFVRHPIYTGVLSMFFGTALAIGKFGVFVGFLILFIGLWIKLRQEENLMITYFGNKYIDYKKKVKALIPSVI